MTRLKTLIVRGFHSVVTIGHLFNNRKLGISILLSKPEKIITFDCIKDCSEFVMLLPICDLCAQPLLGVQDTLSSLSCGHVYHSTCIRQHVSQCYDCKVCHCPASVSSIFSVTLSSSQVTTGNTSFKTFSCASRINQAFHLKFFKK